MAETLAGLGARVVSGGTDNHLLLVDVTPLGVTGKEAEHLLDEIGITVNKNAIPFDTLPPNTASGIRIGTPATTSRGFGPDEMRAVGADHHRRDRAQRDEPAAQYRLAGEVREIVDRFPVPGLPATRDRARPRIGRPNRATSGRDDLHPGPRQRRRPDRRRVRSRPLVLALVLTPVVRRVVLRYEIVDRPGGPPGQHGRRAARRRARGVGRVPRSSRRLPAPQPERGWVPDPDHRSTRRRSRRSCSAGRVAAALGAIDDLFDLRARWQLLGQLALAVGAVALGITIGFIANPFGREHPPLRTARSPRASRSSGSSG